LPGGTSHGIVVPKGIAMTNVQTMTTRCCVVGGGPAGMMLGFLLARSGVDVIVLEKHEDFFRDFRGDTVHPSTLTVLDELGLLDRFLERPHQELRKVTVAISGQSFMVANFGALKTRAPFIAFMPQWDFLNFIAEEARKLPNFHLLMATAGQTLISEAGQVTGVRATGPNGPITIEAGLVVAADGRSSTLRAESGLEVRNLGAPIDVLWFRVEKSDDGFDETLGRLDRGQFMITIDRRNYWQCAYVIPKGGAEALKAGPVAPFKAKVVAAAPYLAEHIDDIANWDDVKLLSVSVDRLEHWSKPGLLCIGDAAHAMSPIGGVGINMAVQDAVATANLLGDALLRGASMDESRLDSVRRRRLFPTRVTQAFQIMVQNRVLVPTLAGGPIKIPALIGLLNRWPALQKLPAYFLGIGVRAEHVARKTP
jgi:2-polyprenyl-6-methoxyphenol hydroxylase-like FAD-dependent oxidoreductase